MGGKTTVVRQALHLLEQPSHYASTDEPALLRSLFRLVCDYSAQLVGGDGTPLDAMLGA